MLISSYVELRFSVQDFCGEFKLFLCNTTIHDLVCSKYEVFCNLIL